MRRLLLGTALSTVLAAALLAAPAAMAVDEIFFTQPYATGFSATPGLNKIYRAKLDGTSAAPTAVPTASTLIPGNPWGVAVDTQTERLYWGTYQGNKISYTSLDGSAGVSDLNTGAATVSGPSGVVLDREAGKIYWGNANGNKISWANLDGSGGGNLNTGTATVSSPIGVAIDAAGGKIYWANYGGNKISFAKLDNSGGGDLNIIGTTVSQPWGVTIDPAQNRVFWGNFTTNALDYATLDGTGGGILATPGAAQLGPMPGAIDPDSGRIYWANWNSPRAIVFANKDGSGSGGTLYPSPGNLQVAMPTILKAPKGTGTPTVTGGSTTPATLACSQGGWGKDLLGEHLYRSPRSFSYAWTRDGAPAGSSASVSATTPGTYRCTVTATNFAGSTSQTSAGFTVSAPPPPPPPPPIMSTTATISSLAFPSYTKLVRLSLKNVVAGSTVRVTCKTKKKRQQKKGCPYKSKRISSPRARASLNLRKPFKNKRIPVGAKITIRVTAPGYVGKQIQYTIRKRKLPRSRVLCIPPGGKAGSCA